MPHRACGPEWKLDRRDSGRLFWRRDSDTLFDAASPFPPSATATPSPSVDRVKFRYDVEVLEFWESDATTDDATTDDDAGDASDVTDDDEGFDEASRRRRRRPDSLATRETSLGQSLFVCVLCVGVLVGTIVYQWWRGK